MQDRAELLCIVFTYAYEKSFEYLYYVYMYINAPRVIPYMCMYAVQPQMRICQFKEFVIQHQKDGFV